MGYSKEIMLPNDKVTRECYRGEIKDKWYRENYGKMSFLMISFVK